MAYKSLSSWLFTTLSWTVLTAGRKIEIPFSTTIINETSNLSCSKDKAVRFQVRPIFLDGSSSSKEIRETVMSFNVTDLWSRNNSLALESYPRTRLSSALISWQGLIWIVLFWWYSRLKINPKYIRVQHWNHQTIQDCVIQSCVLLNYSWVFCLNLI